MRDASKPCTKKATFLVTVYDSKLKPDQILKHLREDAVLYHRYNPGGCQLTSLGIHDVELVSCETYPEQML